MGEGKRTLDEWLAFQTQAHPFAIDLGLARPRAVLERLGWRRPAVPVITVAGTNGKGSVVATCTAVLHAAGLRVGTFTSPHFRDYRERILVGGRRVLASELIDAFERIEAARGELSLTFFEYNTLAALLIFEAARLDAWVLEIGLGGRLDAVNLVDPDVAVVVSIGLDHQDFLGATLADIGREKAGIFRRDRPAVLGSRDMPDSVEAGARAVGARLKRLGREFDVEPVGAIAGAPSAARAPSGPSGPSGPVAPAATGAWRYRGSRWNLDLPAPALRGQIQYANAATALAALEELDGRVRLDPTAIGAGLRAVSLIGRFQLIVPAASGGPVWILDVAHNADAAAILAQNLAAMPVAGRTIGVCGILVDKDAASILTTLQPLIDRWCFASTPGDRGRTGAALAALATGLVSASVTAHESLAQACDAALAAAGSGDRIVVFGSFHTVGPAMDWLEENGLMPRESNGTPG